ncbi:MAG: ribosomal protein S18-alanine N-acetyltransferase, partial [Lachnospiraceae bacterium]|nr:ribosomal protein S18-alanine N-acetyltransferase [Candidatus Minthocola equi]
VYTGLYTCEKEINTVLSQRAIGIDELTEYLLSRHAGEKVIFLGDGVPVFKDIITARLGDSAIFAAAPDNRQRAASVAALGEIIFQNGGAISSDDFSPEYLRQSQAEREYTEVRKASAEDAKIAAFLESLCFDTPWDEAFISSLLKNPCNEVLLAFHEDTPVGYLICQKVSGEGEILRIGVKPDIRRAGIGRRLITVMEEDKKTDSWSLEVRAGNEAAIGLYRICGYKETRIRQDYYSDPSEDALCMEHIIRE